MLDYIRCEQGSEEWHRARAGRITASKVKEIRDRYKVGPNKGQFKETALNLAFRLAIERSTGLPLDDDEFSPWQAARGQRLEPSAREAHEVVAGVVVQPMGFIGTSDGKFGVSVDGLIEPDEGVEYKAFLAPSKLRSIIIDSDWSDVVDQVQFSLWLTGRKRWHMGLYCPQLDVIGRALTLHTAARDEAYIEAMVADLLEFDKVVERYRAALSAQPAAELNPPFTPDKPKKALDLSPSF